MRGLGMKVATMAALMALASTGALAQSGRQKPQADAVEPAKQCAEVPPVVQDITADSFYSDPKRSVADTIIVARNKDRLRPLDRTMRDIIGWSSLWQAKKDSASADCALTWLTAWAQGGAMLGTMSSQQAEGERKWRTSGVAVAWLKLKERAKPEQIAAIETWLKTLAGKVIAAEEKSKVVNNRRYWAGLTATAVGYATGTDTLKQYGKAAFDRGVADVAADGHLPAELDRGQMAAHYHNYAIAPLVLSAEIAARNGDAWYGGNDSAIHRLAAYVAAINVDTAGIAKATGKAQRVPAGGIVGWQAFYAKRFPAKLKLAKGNTGPWEYAWLGGDLTALASAWVR